MAKRYLLFTLLILALCACDMGKEPESVPPEPPVAPEPLSSSVEPVTSSSLPESSSEAPSSSSTPSSEAPPPSSAAPPAAQPPAPPEPDSQPDTEADLLPELDEGLGIIDGVIFKYPVTDRSGVRHTALYQNYSAMVLAIPTRTEGLFRAEALQPLVEAHDGAVIIPEHLADTLIALLPMEGYHNLLEAVTDRIQRELAPRFDQLRQQGIINHFLRFEVSDEGYDAVFIYMEGNKVAALTEIETAFIDDLTDICNMYHELSGQGGHMDTPVRFVDETTGQEYSHLW